MQCVTNRQEWVDIYKAIAIILVVVGHATGQFNMYIYQFHVAAFFFISGWVANFDRDNFLTYLCKKVTSLLIPLFTMVILFWLLKSAFIYLNVDSKLFGNQNSLMETTESFWKTGSMDSFLGPAWFVVILFFASLISHFLYKISGKNVIIFLILTIFLYVYSWEKMKRGEISLPYGIEKALVAQGYFGIAFITKKNFSNYKIKNIRIVSLIMFLFTTLNMYLINEYSNGQHLMDLAGRNVYHLGWSSIAVLNGIIWLCSFSQLISFINVEYIKKLFLFLGKNTMGIMLLHFLGFKLVTLMLYFIKEVPFDMLQNIIPNANVSLKWWWLYTLVSIIFSLLIWMLLNKIPVVSYMLGNKNSLTKQFVENELYKQILTIYNEIICAIVKGTREFYYNIIINIKKHRLLIFTLSIICLFIMYLGIGVIYEKKNMEGSIEVKFPYSDDRIIFEEGWLAQTNDEEYRWVEQESVFIVDLSNQQLLCLEGYVPNNIYGISKVKVYLNDQVITEEQISCNQNISLNINISDKVLQGKNVFRIEFDAERIPEKDDADQRAFSAMFTSIIID